MSSVFLSLLYYYFNSYLITLILHFQFPLYLLYQFFLFLFVSRKNLLCLIFFFFFGDIDMLKVFFLLNFV